jgi:uncharacterized membrane protein YgcG
VIDSENEYAREEHLNRLRTKRDAYVAIFGPPGSPTPLGAVVLADLDTFCTTYTESIHMDKAGRMDPYTTIYRDGKKAVALRIRQMINWSESYGNSSGHSGDSSGSSTRSGGEPAGGD